MRYDKIIGIGLYKTGTSTLAECLRILGMNVCPEAVGYKTLMGLSEAMDAYEAFADYPWFLPNVYKKIDNIFSAGFVLTSRDTDTWYTSFTRWLDRNVHLPNEGLEKVFGDLLTSGDEARITDCYVKHNILAQDFFGRRKNFLVVDWEAGDGWDKLCDFLKAPVPDCEFPHMLRYDPQLDDYVNLPTKKDP